MTDLGRLNEIREIVANDGVTTDWDVRFLLAALDAAEQRAASEARFSAEATQTIRSLTKRIEEAEQRAAKAEQERDKWRESCDIAIANGSDIVNRVTARAEAAEACAKKAEQERDEALAWASVGRTGLCVHSKTMDGCAGCSLRAAEKERDDALSVIAEWVRRAEAAEARLAETQEALGRIHANAVSWHGDDEAKGRALTVIADWSRHALDAAALTTHPAGEMSVPCQESERSGLVDGE